ncbi:MAG: hypothetical protein FD126_1690 [Elusimicrobia bacterium]|nr:MAG: hypothetical protein FD126_1690 [Elusimicrobiota bacterium]
MAVASIVLCLALFCVTITAFAGWLAGVFGSRGPAARILLTPPISLLAQYCMMVPLMSLFTGPDPDFVAPWQPKPGGSALTLLFTVVPWPSQLAIVFTCWGLFIFWENVRGTEGMPSEFKLFGDFAGVAAVAAWVYQAFVGVPWG